MEKIHVVCIPYPVQSHISSMMKLAKILHFRGFQITFVNTEFNHRRLLNARGPDSLIGLHDFRFETIPDGLPPPTNPNASQDIPTLRNGYMENTAVDWIPGIQDIRLKDFPSFVRTTDPNDAMFDFFKGEAERNSNATALIFNTFAALEMEVLDAHMSQLPLPPIYTVGPLHSLLNQFPLSESQSLGSNLNKRNPMSSPVPPFFL